MPHHSDHRTIPLDQLPVDYVTDKIPSGGHVGCKLTFTRHMEMCEDWKNMKGLSDDLDAQVAACRFRLKGPARETSEDHRELNKAPAALPSRRTTPRGRSPSRS